MEPEHIKKQHSSSSKDSKSNRIKTTGSSKIDYKGMTLKQYFMLCDRNVGHHQIDEIQDESRCSSSQSIVQTPTFGLGGEIRANKNNYHKLKTEVDDIQESQPTKKKSSRKKQKQFCPIISHKYSNQLELKVQQGHTSNLNKQKDNDHRKRVVSIPSKYDNSKQLMNRSTLASFYNFSKKNKKMLSKIKNDKSKVSDLKLRDAFLVTKYASKFMVNEKELVTN